MESGIILRVVLLSVLMLKAVTLGIIIDEFIIGV